MSKDGYVFKNQNKQPEEFHGFELIENNQMQNVQSGEWDVIEEKASSYQKGYDKHMSMQRRVKGMAADKRGDNEAMTSIKTNLAKISESMQSEIAATPMKFRVQMADTVLLYESLIRSCNSFIKTAKKKTAIEKERLRMVKEVLEQAEKERIHFADLGSGMKIFKERVEGMVLGNVLGGILTEYHSVAITDDIEVMKKANGEYTKYREDEDKGTAAKVYLNTASEKLSDSAKESIGMSRIFEFLGAGNLCDKNELAIGRDKKGKRYFGRRAELPRLGTNSIMNIDELKNFVDQQNQINPDFETHIEYTGEALQQLSRIYMLRLIAGKSDVNETSDIKLLYSEKLLEGKKAFVVTGAFLQASSGYFSEMDASSLKKGTKNRPSLDGLPLPVLDAEFAVSILAMRPEDIGFLVEDLQLSKAQRKALSSRITQLQKMLSDKMAKEENLPLERRTIIKPTEWTNLDSQPELQKKFAKEQNVMFPTMLGKNVRIECGGDESQNEQNYIAIYHTLKKKIQSEKDPRKAFLLMARFAAGAVIGAMDNLCKNGTEVAEDISSRLVNELITEDMVKEVIKFRYEAQKRIAEAYDKIKNKVDKVPAEFRNPVEIENAIGKQMQIMRSNAGSNNPVDEEELRAKATAKVEEKIKLQYTCYLMTKENLSLESDMVIVNAMITKIGESGFSNHTNNKNIYPAGIMRKFSKDLENMVPEGVEAYKDNATRGRDLYDVMTGLRLLDKQKVKELRDVSDEEFKKLGLSDLGSLALLAQRNQAQ